MVNKDELISKLAKIISGYRQSELGILGDDHVTKWISQFDDVKQIPILTEMIHVMDKIYFTRKDVTKFLSSLVKNPKLAGDDPCAFWSGVHFLDIQQRGNSQREFLAIFEESLLSECRHKMADCGKDIPHTYFYLDDALFSGGHIENDLKKWIVETAPNSAKVAILTIAYHTQGQFFANQNLEKIISDSKKKISLKWYPAIEIEDRKGGTSQFLNNSDVLRPTTIPPEAQAYADGLGAMLDLRTPGKVGALELFSSEAGRELLEQEFLKMGVYIRSICPRFNDYQRPLGNTRQRKLGFGSMLVTFRNCPNNAPLVLWAGNPWYPLFPRSTN